MLALIIDNNQILGSVLSLCSENKLFSCNLLAVSMPTLIKKKTNPKTPKSKLPPPPKPGSKISIWEKTNSFLKLKCSYVFSSNVSLLSCRAISYGTQEIL